MPEVEVTVCVVSPTVLTATDSCGEVAPARTAGEANADMAAAAMATTVERRGIEIRRREELMAEGNHGRSSGRVQMIVAGIRDGECLSGLTAPAPRTTFIDAYRTPAVFWKLGRNRVRAARGPRCGGHPERGMRRGCAKWA